LHDDAGVRDKKAESAELNLSERSISTGTPAAAEEPELKRGVRLLGILIFFLRYQRVPIPEITEPTTILVVLLAK
jgi:hypothetical protein